MGCMIDKGKHEICPHCGYKEGIIPNEQYHLLPGTILNGRYLIGKALGHGGFGITYLGFDTNQGVKLAIKEYMPSELATRFSNEKQISIYSGKKQQYFNYGLEKFLDEAKTLARFSNHPSIVSVYDYFEENKTAYLVMRYLEGITLGDYVSKQGGRIPYELAMNIMMPVVDALREVHNYGMIHRDISPDNIYITSKKQVKLLDFGAARHAIGEQNKSLSIILKPGYAPPEQYYSNGKQGPWTDIYATAATIYRLITGISPGEAMERMIDDKLTLPSKYGIEIDEKIEQALIKGLSLKVEDRYQTMKEFQDEILGIDVSPKEMKNNSTTTPETVMKRPVKYEEAKKGSTSKGNNEKRNQRKNNKKTMYMIYIGLAIAGIIFLLAVGFIFRYEIYKEFKSYLHK